MASPTKAERSPEPDLDRLHDDLQSEYAKLADTVTVFDQRLRTIKGWGVTLSLASLGFGFQQDHYGVFLVAAASGLAFWLVEATTKLRQIRYYPRMGDIELIAYELFGGDTPTGPASSPLIDWGWHTAGPRVRKRTAGTTPVSRGPGTSSRVARSGRGYRPTSPSRISSLSSWGRFCSCLGLWGSLARSE